MKIIEKIKKLDNIPINKIFWVIPLIEVLIFLPVFLSLIRMNILLVSGFNSLFPLFSGFAYFILKLGILYDSTVLEFLSFTPFVLKFVFSIF